MQQSQRIEIRFVQRIDQLCQRLRDQRFQWFALGGTLSVSGDYSATLCRLPDG